MWFWLKHLLLAAVLLGAAAYLLLNDGPLFGSSTHNNPAASGMSSFYENFRNSLGGSSERDKYIIKLEQPQDDLEQLLVARLDVVQPTDTHWQGQVKNRRFNSGDTLKKVMSRYAQEEGVTFYWHLDKDYVVKHPFRVEDSFTHTLYRVGRAIDSDFEYEVQAFYCNNERAAIITERPIPYVREHCQKMQQ